MKTLLYVIIILWVVLAVIEANAFEKDQCVFNEQYNQHKKITKVRTFVYEYCIYNKLKCEGKFTVRKKWFDKNHVKTACPSVSLIDDKFVDNSLELFGIQANFKKREYTCKCGCKQNKITTQLTERIQKLRNFIKLPIYITSGYRCVKHNKAVGGVENSQHLLGKAADIRVKKSGKWLTGRELLRLVNRSGLFRNDGIGIYWWGLHLDVRGYHARWFVK